MMIGVAMMIERPISREGDLASPAMIAMYSRPAAANRVWPIRASELESRWGKCSSKGVKCTGNVVGHRPERREDQQRKRGDHGSARYVVDPLAERQPADRRERERPQQNSQPKEDGGMAFRHPRRARPNHVRKLARDLKQDRRDRRQPVRPDVPRRQEPDGVAKRAPRPHVEAALQRHLAVEKVNRNGHRRVEDGEGEQPDQGLRVAQPRREPHPRASHHREHLREHKVAQRELAREMVIAGAVGGGETWVGTGRALPASSHRTAGEREAGEFLSCCEHAGRGGHSKFVIFIT